MKETRRKRGSIKRGLLVLLLLMSLPMSAWAADYYVATTGNDLANSGLSSTSPWKTIAHALEQVTVGSIHVAAGTYSATTTGESFPLNMKQGVNLLGANRDTTILDGENTAMVVLANGISSGTLAGFTITKGKPGIRLINCSINVADNIINNNQAEDGAGINTSDFRGVISQNTISSNLATGTGGGIRLVDPACSISNNIISKNSAGVGGGLYVVEGNASISGNQISENQAYVNGGGLYIADSATTMEGNLILSNQATKGSGGAVFTVNWSGNMINNLIVKNVADAVGGIYAANSSASTQMINNTVADNIGTLAGSVGGMQAAGVSGVLKNNIFWNNGADDLYGGLTVPFSATDPVTEGSVGISYSIIDDYAGLANNIYADPLFVDPLTNDYHLSAGSAAIDAGTSLGAPTVDLEGTARPQGASTDIGAYEYVAAGPGLGGTILIYAYKHYVGQGSHPGSSKEPYSGLTVNVYDKSPGSCVLTHYGVSWRNYHDIVYGDGVNPPCDPVASGVTDANGELTLTVDAGEYVIIGIDETGLPNKHLGTSATVGAGETVTKHLKLIIKANGKKNPGKTRKHKETKESGEEVELLITEPEYVEWDSTEELYPFIFESTDIWSVSVGITPPAGFVPDHDSLSEDVNNEEEAVQFTITDVGSKWQSTSVEFRVEHEGASQGMGAQGSGQVIITSTIDVVAPSGKLIIKAEKELKEEEEEEEEEGKQPLADLAVRIYDKDEGSCAAGIGISWQHYPEVIAQCTPDYAGTTNVEGMLEFDPITIGEYLIIGGDGTDKHLGTSVDIEMGETARKRLKQEVEKEDHDKDKDKDKEHKDKKKGKDKDKDED